MSVLFYLHSCEHVSCIGEIILRDRYHRIISPNASFTSHARQLLRDQSAQVGQVVDRLDAGAADRRWIGRSADGDDVGCATRRLVRDNVGARLPRSNDAARIAADFPAGLACLPPAGDVTQLGRIDTFDVLEADGVY